MNSKKSPVTLIGLGPMGQAMVRTLLGQGHPVTVWNRTPSRAEPLVVEGARLAASPTEAVASSDLVILSLTDYQAMYDILSTAESALAGRTIVNLSSDDPDVTREAAKWAAKHGATFIAGGVMTPAPTVGTEAAYVFYSGPKSAFDAHEPVLRHIGGPRFLGEDTGLAQLYYLAHLDVFLTTLASVVHATALVSAAGVDEAAFAPEAIRMVIETGQMLAAEAETGLELGRNLASGNHPGELATAVMMGATADHIVSAAKGSGVDLVLPEAVKSLYDRTVAAGHGKDSWTAMYEIIKKKAA
ncbi:NAD(P)-dependent oxidoreductase [Stackebrandtia nassauensis]|uniref:6-phosphogluconate dehydrogenase NAD-binding protein n=1 Tax=Stackebrandtia nassauensis (strain DSM 44728 / CIP 108903 / NRRL B-16338 / NBRC 102104 / LLR-40K-21) TaxID=446470 RepID=D3Q3R0_STANL|nr:NAD(P)-dependent oxidoreductase [Stackebrandtia nassauensis]ADD43977.1 6-phosphogluconate dehydrogenase NAD-binding protein [Stackebrandtia nassauensis DSM 44728]6JIZ_A Chain A, 6-phosphogluconate dehydrogenase NAD-binding protein [Stackebrandtia nassauensis DSM 44728]6JIZ_B Chain B, 6-phosphogluconate dehydrogenase NAD-binding protein [Stackebrandtia nassauensis DSM 44728]6JIZ_C Chain C, 6-phosphogluconate dehydrogenase NAD-binding protein [Stackebrandtia nassauensis DSM 44728]